MTKHELSTCHNFSTKEVEKTGAKLRDVHFGSFCTLQFWRTLIGYPVRFQFNGITSGKHKSREHPDGKAYDVYIILKRGQELSWETARWMIKQAVRAGFNGIGVYWNGTMFSFHLDTGLKIRRWIAVKPKGGRKWFYRDLYNNPKEIL